MKTYFKIIGLVQQTTLAMGILLLCLLPTFLVFGPAATTGPLRGDLFLVAHLSLFFVMLIRPMADIWKSIPWLRALVILRKGFGVLSAAIIVSFILEKIVIDPLGYFSAWFGSDYWSFENLAFVAHVADISAILLLVTSNNLSKRLLGPWWKRVQRLSYVYFYGSAIYVFFIVGDPLALYYMLVVTTFTLGAFIKKRLAKQRTITETATV
jgi:DMSO/TMAO reductase YedYZ heme-binding membrane subunit